MEKYSFETPIGYLTLEGDSKSLSKVSFLETSDQKSPNSKVLREARKQLDEYFSGYREAFDIPLSPEGTDFQKKTWNALIKIPFGSSATYGDIAKEVKCPNGQRAVGMANNKNPLAIIVPCHRVIGKNGTLTGYAGGLKAKKFLLNLENNKDFKD